MTHACAVDQFCQGVHVEIVLCTIEIDLDLDELMQPVQRDENDSIRKSKIMAGPYFSNGKIEVGQKTEKSKKVPRVRKKRKKMLSRLSEIFCDDLRISLISRRNNT